MASISETAAPTPYPFYAERMAAAQDTSTPIQVGTNEVIVSVTVAYLIR